MTSISIAGHQLGSGRCFVIAEAGVNHNGDIDLARRLIDLAVEAGADAVKFQTFKSEEVISAGAPKADYQVGATGTGESQLEMIRKLELSFADFEGLKGHCDRRGIVFLSTPFDFASADFLNELGVPAFKVPSGEITNLPLVRHVAGFGRPAIVSTGMSTLEEVRVAVETVLAADCPGLALLHCVSNYPTDPHDANLRAMATLEAEFGCPVGFSDHTTGIDISLAAAALGAAVIEKHFTLDRSLPGPDHRASLSPLELHAMVAGIRRIEQALGDGVKAPRASEANTRAVARRSLFTRGPISAGQPLAWENLVALRPAGGIAPSELDKVVGRLAARDLAPGAMLAWADLA